MAEFPNLGLVISGRQANPDGSVSDMVNGDVITPAPQLPEGQTSTQVGKYNLGDLYKYMGGSYSLLTDWLSRPDVPDDRKAALVSSLLGKINSLPEHSGLDLLSEQVIGTSNYQKAMQKLSGELSTALDTAINGNYEEGYNSEAQQAARAREAGVNPDLSGVSPGQATDTNEMATPYAGLSEPVEPSQFVNFGFQGVQLIAGFVGQFQQWINNDITNSLHEVALDDAMRNNIRESFAAAAQDKDTLTNFKIDAIRERFSDYAGMDLSSVKTEADIVKWIDAYNKDNPQSPLTMGDLTANAILKSAKSSGNPFTSVRTRRAYDRAMSAISPASPFVQSYVKQLEADAASGTKSVIKDELEIKSLLGDYGKAFQASFQILQDAENEMNEYTKKYYRAKNGTANIVSGVDDNGNEMFTQEDIVAMEVQAEAEETHASKLSAIANKYRTRLVENLRKQFDESLERIAKSKGQDSWQYVVASIAYPSIVSWLEQGAAQQLGAMLMRQKPAPHNSTHTTTKNTYIDSHNFTDIDSYH